jgi:hypothetical protein
MCVQDLRGAEFLRQLRLAHTEGLLAELMLAAGCEVVQSESQPLRYYLGASTARLAAMKTRTIQSLLAGRRYLPISFEWPFPKWWFRRDAEPLARPPIEHWSSCSINRGPAYFPMKCDCGGFRADKEFVAFSDHWDCSLVGRIRRTRQLWTARIIWKEETLASLPRFLLTIATHSKLRDLFRYNRPYTAQPSAISIHRENERSGG